MEQAGASTTEHIVDANLQALAIASLHQLANMEERTATGQGPIAGGRHRRPFLSPILAGRPPWDRVSERLAGEVWGIGWNPESYNVYSSAEPLSDLTPQP